MAEAGVDIQTNTGRFFCHKCNEELSHVLEDFTCPKCKGGFVEKLSDAPAPNPARGTGNTAPGLGMNHLHEGLPFLELLRGLTRDMDVNVSSPSSVASGQNPRSAGSGSGTRSPDMNFSFVMDVRPRGSGGAAAGGPATAGQNAQPAYNPMENMLFSFLNDLITGLSGGGVTVGGGLPMLANIGDYVWGRDGLDAIVTQLMNQMEGTGPPPMPSEKLDRLPSVKICQDQIDRKLQCSVCWDDFQLNEEVKQLECDHLFHPGCIVPWLKLHGTCPICRKDLTTAEEANAVPSTRFDPPSRDNSRNDDNPGGQSRGQGSTGRATNDLDRMDFEFD